jgi:hypothetical protein
MPDFNFDAYNHDEVPVEQDGVEVITAETELQPESPAPADSNPPSEQEEVDKW